MRVQRVQQTNTSFKGITIKAEHNKDVKFLYNKVLDVIHLDKLANGGGCGATFTRDTINLATERPTILDKLTELGIKWFKDKK